MPGAGRGAQAGATIIRGASRRGPAHGRCSWRAARPSAAAITTVAAGRIASSATPRRVPGDPLLHLHAMPSHRVEHDRVSDEIAFEEPPEIRVDGTPLAV